VQLGFVIQFVKVVDESKELDVCDELGKSVEVNCGELSIVSVVNVENVVLISSVVHIWCINVKNIPTGHDKSS
jgi:hypothetical protein